MTIKYDQYEDGYQKRKDAMNEEMKNVLQAVGLACEMASLIREQMEQNGFTRDEAVAVAGSYILSVLNPRGGDSCETD